MGRWRIFDPTMPEAERARLQAARLAAGTPGGFATRAKAEAWLQRERATGGVVGHLRIIDSAEV